MSNIKTYRNTNLKLLDKYASMFKNKKNIDALKKRIIKGNLQTNTFIKSELKINYNNFKENREFYSSSKLTKNKAIFKKLNMFDESEKTIDMDNIDKKNVWYHYKFYRKMVNKNNGAIIQHIVRFYEDGKFKKSVNITAKTKKEFKKLLLIKLQDGSDGEWKVKSWLSKPNTKVVIITRAFNKLENLQPEMKYLQTFMDNDTGTCVYDAFLKFFENKKSFDGKRLHKKLLNNSNLYKKAYDLKNIETICELVESSLTIVDLIDGNDIKINVNSMNKFNLKMINTKYNHLDLLSNDFDKIEVNKDEYDDIKNNSNFYIESFNKLYLVDKTYIKKDSDFSLIYKEWKNEINYNRFKINENSDSYNFISNYDFSMHCFFNDKIKINNLLYKEMDLKKAYYNYSNINLNRFYQGVPSGSFICVKCDDNFDFTKLKNKCGFYQVEILTDSKHLKYFGFIKNNTYILTDPIIKLLIEHNIKLKFINACYSPKIDMPFNDKFLLNFDSNGMISDDRDQFNFKGYVKATGLMLARNEAFNYTIKPLKCDDEFYSCFYSDNNDIYSDNNLIHIKRNNEDQFSHIHIYYFIHSYTKALILEQMFKMDCDDIIGVKLDSIIYKGDYNINKIFSSKDCNIETLLKNNSSESLDDGLDDGLDENDNGLFRPYFFECNEDFNFKKSFLYTDEYIYENVVFIGGPGGTGKTHSLLSTLEPSKTVYTTICWNLIKQMRNIYNCSGYSIPKLTGQNMGKKCDMINEDTFNNTKNLVIDEATMIPNEIIKKLIKKFKQCNIFILGDINENGQAFQLMIEPNIINKFDKMQYIKYTVNFRHDQILNGKLLQMREKMIELYNKKDNINLLINYVKKDFKNNFSKKEDIIFTDEYIGISTNNELGECSNNINEYFINKGAKPRYIYKYTDLKNGFFKGCQVDEKLANDENFKNKEMNLFKSVHSVQGLTIPTDKKLLLFLGDVFHFNLLYTAFSRCKRLDQIVIIY